MKDEILKILNSTVGLEAADLSLSVPEHEGLGHYATNAAMRLAASRKKKPLELARELADEIKKKAPAGFFEKVEAAAPGFINFWLSKSTLQNELLAVAREKDFGKSNVGKKKTVIVEYSQPNIAKMMHVGHLRTTIIGAALANILEDSGYKAIRWNYLGDWGTQFGKLITAYKLWGKKAEVEKNPIAELQKLYVRFHEEAKAAPELEKQGQEEFKKLEGGDQENRKLWEWFRKESIKEFEAIYEILGVDFDVWIGESFFEPELKSLAKTLLEKKIAERSEGAIVVKLDEFNLPPAIIEKSDGASIYLTRDIANLQYRFKKYKPAQILYVVANEQSLHFEQLFAIAKKMGLDAMGLKHIKYGLVLGEAGKKLSTREGRTELVKEVIDEAILKAREVIQTKQPDISEKEKTEIAFAVALGALKYNDLKENRMTDIVFDWEKMLDFSGDSGPYLQYTYSRMKSILRKAGKMGKYDVALLAKEEELALVRKIFEFPEIVQKAGTLYSTSTLATYLYKFAVLMNKFYETTPVLVDENILRRNARLLLTQTAARTLQKGLGLLGIATPEKI
jgi:arginyl-tRNA synthetase